MTVFIDGDGCPVVDIAVKSATTAGWDCVIICDTSHHIEKADAKTITVSQGADSVDFALVNLIKAGDIVITQDYGLAAMCLARRAFGINQNGLVYTNDNIDALLTQRHTARKVRSAGGRLKGPSKRTPEQDRAFEKALSSLLNQIE
ncbi:MAG: YaiI/YqxD family protein [Defluviitaleaceae bacterium]|nr:YaiI/YqxD family protein [Defluviitaleaceae bacterium]